MNNENIRHILSALALGFVLCWGEAYNAPNHTRINRYMSIANKPLASQSNLLAQVRQVTFPKDIKTVGDAIHYLLLFSGYRLAPVAYHDKAVRTMLSNPLPEVDRTLGPISLQKGLETLAGRPFVLLADPVHRLISFKLNPAYQPLYHLSTREVLV